MKKTKLKKMLLTTMWPAMYICATINHLSCLAKAWSCLQVVGKRRLTVMLMATKHAEVGTWALNITILDIFFISINIDITST